MIVHLSVDDVLKSLIEPNSLMLTRMQEWHYKYDARFTLYCYCETEGLAIEKINPGLQDYGEWLNFGFHSENATPFIDDSHYRNSFSRVRRAFARIGLPTTDCLRLHYWDATEKQKQFLKRHGIRAFLTQDSDALPYDIDDTYIDCGLTHYRTRVCFEKIEEVTPQSLHVGLKHIVAFTHEWCFDEQADKIEQALQIYNEAGYKFVN